MLGLATAGSIYMPLSDETAFRLLPVGRPRSHSPAPGRNLRGLPSSRAKLDPTHRFRASWTGTY